MYEFYAIVMKVEFFYDEETEESFSNFAQNYISEEIFAEFDEEYTKFEEVYQRAYEDITSVTQEEFDEATEKCIAIYSNIIDCFEGYHITGVCTDLGDGTHTADCTFCKTTGIIEEHSFGEYISDGNATTEADGTKTAKCDKCAATDTVTDEGSKLDSEKDSSASFFDFILDFFSKLFDFIKNLFG